jgi:hypothetical protein
LEKWAKEHQENKSDSCVGDETFCRETVLSPKPIFPLTIFFAIIIVLISSVINNIFMHTYHLTCEKADYRGL